MAAKKKTVPYWRRLQLKREAAERRKQAKARAKATKQGKRKRRLVAVICIYEYY